MASVKIKKVKVGSGALKDINAQFNNVMGEGELDPAIIGPKYKDIHHNIELVIKIFKNFADFIKNLKDHNYNKQADHMHTMRLKWNEELIENKNIKDLQEAYKAIKNGATANAMLELYGGMKKYEQFIMDMDGEFIEEFPTVGLYIFRKVKLDFKDLYIYTGGDDVIKTQIRSYILQSLQLLCRATKHVYKVITTPDFDIKATSEFLIKALLDVQKHIPRCRKAFAKIRESVSMLEDNFSEYYKDFLGSRGDNTMIMQSFISDIMKDSKSDFETARQFREIIRFLQSKALSSKSNDPRIKVLLDRMKEMDMLASGDS